MMGGEEGMEREGNHGTLTLRAIFRSLRPSQNFLVSTSSADTYRDLTTYFLFLSVSSMLPGDTVIFHLPQMLCLTALYLQGNLTISAVLEKVMTLLPLLASHVFEPAAWSVWWGKWNGYRLHGRELTRRVTTNLSLTLPHQGIEPRETRERRNKQNTIKKSIHIEPLHPHFSLFPRVFPFMESSE